MALWLAAQIAGDDVAKAIQLGIEYDPQPLFDSGSVAKADPELVAFLPLLVEDGGAVTTAAAGARDEVGNAGPEVISERRGVSDPAGDGRRQAVRGPALVKRCRAGRPPTVRPPQVSSNTTSRNGGAGPGRDDPRARPRVMVPAITASSGIWSTRRRSASHEACHIDTHPAVAQGRARGAGSGTPGTPTPLGDVRACASGRCTAAPPPASARSGRRRPASLGTPGPSASRGRRRAAVEPGSRAWRPTPSGTPAQQRLGSAAAGPSRSTR